MATLELRRIYDFLTRLRYKFEPLHAQLLARRPYVSLMDALTEVHNEEIHLHDADLLQSATVLAAHSSASLILCLLILLLMCHLPHLRLFLLLLMVRVLVFIVVAMDM
jgi:hypothetical protein